LTTYNHHLLDALQLPRGMVWADEFDWQPVEAATEYATDGALVMDVAVRQAGRPISLRADDDAGWMRRDTLQSLQALASAPGAVYVLRLADGRSFDVVFAPGDPIRARPIARPELPQAAHPYVVEIQLITV
jgi:hypothetical protein